MAAMSNDTKDTSSSGTDLKLKKLLLYREFQAERGKFLKHKWIESEKAGSTSASERALTDWIVGVNCLKWRKIVRSAKPDG